MTQPNDIQEELRLMGSPLAEMPRTMPYAVPEGYFDGLDNEILAWATTANADTHFNIGTKGMPYAVPGGYFEGLPEQMLFAALESEQVPALPKATPFATPAGYFDQLPAQMLQAAQKADATPNKPAKKTISLGRALRWAAAAVLLLGVGITSYNVLIPGEKTTEQAIAALPNNLINEYVNQNATVADVAVNTSKPIAGNMKELKQLKDEDITGYLDETGWDESFIN